MGAKGGENVITKQELTSDEFGNIKLRNYCSADNALTAARVARETNESGFFGDKNGECRLMGYIPEEMFSFVPWLMEARKAAKAGDKGKEAYYISKFFELYPAFAGNRKTRYWRGHRAVLL